MNVGELRALLAQAPDHLPVTVRAVDANVYEVSRLVMRSITSTYFPPRDLVACGPYVAVIVGDAKCPPSS